MLVCKYPITGADFPKLDPHTGETVRDVWGAPANPVDLNLHHKAMLRVQRRLMKVNASMTIKEALADKEYRRRGGKFAFPSPLDTFIRGLHRRTMDLHNDWKVRLHRETAGTVARDEAIEEMLLRLRWEDGNGAARAKLSLLVGRIWDGLEGLDLSAAAPLSSALWLDGEDRVASGACTEAATEAPKAAATAPVPVPASEPAALAAAPAVTSPASAAPVAIEPTLPVVVEVSALREQHAAPGLEPAAVPSPASARVGQFPVGREAAEAAMDADLQETLDKVDQEVRRRVTAFAELRNAGSRMKLPLDLRAKQRKALHLWAETQGLGHRSFGYRGRRRLHLFVQGPAPEAPGAAGQAPAAPEDDADFDFTAWQSDDEQHEA